MFSEALRKEADRVLAKAPVPGAIRLDSLIDIIKESKSIGVSVKAKGPNFDATFLVVRTEEGPYVFLYLLGGWVKEAYMRFFDYGEEPVKRLGKNFWVLPSPSNPYRLLNTVEYADIAITATSKRLILWSIVEPHRLDPENSIVRGWMYVDVLQEIGEQ